MARIFEPVRKRAPRPAWTGSSTRRPSDIPPVTVPPPTVANASPNGHPVGSPSGDGATAGPGGGGGTAAPPVDQPVEG